MSQILNANCSLQSFFHRPCEAAEKVGPGSQTCPYPHLVDVGLLGGTAIYGHLWPFSAAGGVRPAVYGGSRSNGPRQSRPTRLPSSGGGRVGREIKRVTCQPVLKARAYYRLRGEGP